MADSRRSWQDRLIALLLERATPTDPEAAERALARLVQVLERQREPPRGERITPVVRNGAHRWDHDLIERHVAEGVSVLDLGCGSGTLLKRLMETKSVRGQGIELDPEQCMECIANGVPVFQTNLDDGLAGFPDESFDYVVLEETVQTLHRPVFVLTEMVRVGKRGIVTFPNFGHWQVRLDLALSGRMPVTRAWPYEWYESPNIRPLTVRDFQAAAADHGIRIVEGQVLTDGQVRPLDPDDNLFAEEVMLVIEKA